MRDLLTLIVVLLAAGHAKALTIGQYENQKNSTQHSIYILGVSNGIIGASAAQESLFGQAPFICPPGRLSLNPDNVKGLIATEVKRLKTEGSFENDLPVELIVLAALRSTFPCN